MSHCDMDSPMSLTKLLLLLLLQLMFLPLQCLDKEGKCHFRSIQDNVYKPGEAIVGGILSLIIIFPRLLNYTKVPDKSHKTAK